MLSPLELAEHLGSEVRTRYGTQARFEFTWEPIHEEYAIRVHVTSPAYLANYNFTYHEGDPLPHDLDLLRPIEPIRWTMRNDPTQFVEINPNVRTFTTNATNLDTPITEFVQLPPVTNDRLAYGYDIETRTIRETLPMPRLRTVEEEEFYRRVADLDSRTILVPAEDWERYTNLRATTSERILPVPRTGIAIPTPPVIPTRTPAQEDRLRDIEEARNHRDCTPEECIEWNSLRALGPCPTPNPPRIYVRVHRSTERYPGNRWEITVKVGTEIRELPTSTVIKSLLNPADKHFISGRQGRRRTAISILNTALESGLPVQSLHDALRAWAMANENRLTSVESVMPTGGIDAETANLLRAQPATLEIGGRVYRLAPTHEIDMRPLITRTRQRTVAAAQVEVTAIRERARVDARTLTTEAERSAQRLRDQAAEEARRAGVRVPDWIRDSNRPHYFDNGRWHVKLSIGCYLRDIRYYISEWGTTLHWHPTYPNPRNEDWYRSRRIWCWFRVEENGRWDSHSIFTMDREYITPHIVSYMCMDLQNLPNLVKDMNTLNQLEAAITRGMQVINLNSPLSREVSKYFPEIREQMPEITRKLMLHDLDVRPARNMSIAAFKTAYPAITWDSEETISQENAGTFNVSDPVPSLPTHTPEVQDTLDHLAEVLRRP